ncbi:uncharacterized protein K452DRAFT_64834 [Aplosporella prunicola CBS 121167]|uniref:Uncharacterized protein n=1 Tax=Aplosporella prunicola CBS 121167 TaxID=1176127 RepID=A0A6A6B8W2_9PEZI|nr:uncharacterized protein K452DRAFT_64834 [Aplosporella prunicola CBS 121167]KAF2139735.1 hypothetical protein K452DRAFT_64834 [Aplosporella prunicola CBS 121167]
MTSGCSDATMDGFDGTSRFEALSTRELSRVPHERPGQLASQAHGWLFHAARPQKLLALRLLFFFFTLSLFPLSHSSTERRLVGN